MTGGQTLKSLVKVRTYSNDKELVNERRHYLAEQAVKVFHKSQSLSRTPTMLSETYY